MGSYFQMNDEALLQRTLAGEAAAFEVLYRRYARRLLGFLFGFLHSQAEAEEVLHETFLALWEGKCMEEVLSVKAWLFTVARNRALKRLRGRRLYVVGVNESVSPEDNFVEKESECAMNVAVEDLPPRLLEVYELRKQGKNYQEIAHSLDVPLGTVKSRMHVLVKFLKERMKPWTVN